MHSRPHRTELEHTVDGMSISSAGTLLIRTSATAVERLHAVAQRTREKHQAMKQNKVDEEIRQIESQKSDFFICTSFPFFSYS